jgi:hypothetical protein
LIDALHRDRFSHAANEVGPQTVTARRRHGHCQELVSSKWGTRLDEMRYKPAPARLVGLTPTRPPGAEPVLPAMLYPPLYLHQVRET